MREPVRRAVAALDTPSAIARAEALAHWGSSEAHETYLATWPCLSTIEVQPPTQGDAPTGPLNVAAWNIERCKWPEASADLVKSTQADILLATELDIGMARSGQRHTIRDLAGPLGFGYAFGVEFVELGTGDARETAEHEGTPNAHGLHGNAILSRWPLESPALIPLDDGGLWFVTAPKADGQYRVGGRMAMAAQVTTPNGPVTLASVHLESESDAEGRAHQIARLLEDLDALYGPGPAIVGGDLNTRDFLGTGLHGADLLADPAAVEPCFATFAAHGFSWTACNTGDTTTRQPPWVTEGWTPKTLDWLFVRGLAADDPKVIPAVSTAGAYLSDHDMVAARITP